MLTATHSFRQDKKAELSGRDILPCEKYEVRFYVDGDGALFADELQDDENIDKGDVNSDSEDFQPGVNP